MKLLVNYSTNVRIPVTSATYKLEHKDVELEALEILRIPVGRVGAARNRYSYRAVFEAPADAAFASGGKIVCNIFRDRNKHFNPKKLTWDGNRCELIYLD